MLSSRRHRCRRSRHRGVDRCSECRSRRCSAGCGPAPCRTVHRRTPYPPGTWTPPRADRCHRCSEAPARTAHTPRRMRPGRRFRYGRIRSRTGHPVRRPVHGRCGRGDCKHRDRVASLHSPPRRGRSRHMAFRGRLRTRRPLWEGHTCHQGCSSRRGSSGPAGKPRPCCAWIHNGPRCRRAANRRPRRTRPHCTECPLGRGANTDSLRGRRRAVPVRR